MNALQRRLVSFAGSTIAVEYSGSQAQAIVDLLYRHIPQDSNARPHLTYRLDSSERPDKLVLYRGEALVYQGDCAGTCAELLLGDTCYHLADQSRGGLLFHAACLAWQSQGVLLPGESGSGKTTLAAWLTTRGFTYLTDELVFVPWGSNTMQAFTRPLNLKAPSKAILQDCIDFDEQPTHKLRGPNSYLLALPDPTGEHAEPAPGLLIFPRYAPGEVFTLRALSKAQAGLELMQCLVNARNLPDYGLAEIARLSQAAPAYTMRYSSLAHIEEQIEDLLHR